MDEVEYSDCCIFCELKQAGVSDEQIAEHMARHVRAAPRRVRRAYMRATSLQDMAMIAFDGRPAEHLATLLPH